MLSLFRKYQKGVLSVVTVIVIASFTFFGVARTNRNGITKQTDRVVGKWIDGKACYERDLLKLVHFLETDFLDLWVVENKSYVNFFNDGIVRGELLESGTIEAFADAYFPLFENELKEKIAQHKNFKPYVHPQKAVSVEALWKQIFPLFHDTYQKFLQEEDIRKAFSRLVELFLYQGLLPPHSVREMLYYQQRQYRGMVMEDPQLRNTDLSLFYAKGLSDWFGKGFVRLLAQFIYNGAIYAKDKGYKVSFEEAKANLHLVAYKHFERMSGGKKGEKGEFEEFYARQLALSGMQEREVVLLWQKMLYFRKLFQDVGGGVFVDAALYKEFHNYASKEVDLTLYEMPSHLQFKHEDEVEKWGLYVEAVSGKKDSLEPPTSLLPLEKIIKETPEIVEKRFLVRVAKIDAKDLFLEIPLRKVWDWEADETHRGILQEKFPLLANAKEDFAMALKNLSLEEREKVDAFARQKILQTSSEWITEKLSRAPFGAPEIVSIPGAGESTLFLRCKDREALLSALESDDERLSFYTEDGEHFYRFKVLDRSQGFTVMPFEEAERRGALHALLEKRKVKPYKGNMQNIFVSYMKKMREKTIRGEMDFSDSTSLQGELAALPEIRPLDLSWRLVKREMKVERKKMAHPFEESVFI